MGISTSKTNETTLVNGDNQADVSFTGELSTSDNDVRDLLFDIRESLRDIRQILEIISN